MNPYLKYFTAISTLYVALLLLGNDSLAYYFKPSLLPFLILAVNGNDPFPTKKWLLSALLFSWIGDIILMFSDKGELFFIFGLVSFLIAHIIFIVLFIKQDTEDKPVNKTLLGLGVVAVIAYLSIMLSTLYPSLGGLKIPVTVYAICISTMLAMSIRGALAWRKPMNLLILGGALSFVTSDSLLAINKFYTPLPKASFLIMITYLVAQYLITDGVLKLNNRK